MPLAESFPAEPLAQADAKAQRCAQWPPTASKREPLTFNRQQPCQCDRPGPDGVTATLCVRPHLVGLGDGPNALTGALAEVQWRGSTHRLYVDVEGHRIKADLRELRDTPALGDQVTLHFAAEDAVLLPAGATGVNDG